MDKIRDKGIMFYINEDKHARLRIQLYYDELPQSKFINILIDGYLNNNPLIRKYIDECIIERNTKRKKKNRQKDFNERDESINDFALNKDEVENIFDILESENPDL
jgi:hypothetical protein